MKIIQLTAENVKKLTAVEISPDGNMVQITGKNGQGKTSVLDAIWWALAGTEHIQKQPIRNGADKARIELKLGTGTTVELIVERSFSEKASYLSVKTADGAKYPSPQKMLDDLLGALTFDPLDFMRRDGKGQFAVLKGLVQLDIDLDAAALADKTDYEKRTIINRDAKAKRAQAVAIIVAADLPVAAIDEGALLDRIQAVANENAAIERRKGNRAAAVSQIHTLTTESERIRGTIEPDVRAIVLRRDQECDDLQRQIDSLTQRIADTKDRAGREATELTAARSKAAADADKEAETLKFKLEAAGPLPEPVDLSALRAELDQAKAINAKIAARDQRAAVEKEAESLEAQSGALTGAMEARAKSRLEAIGKAKMPVDGLSFGDGVVTFNGLPLDQASDAEQLMISTAIAAALNPKLRVIRIRDGSLLDDDAMERLAKFADERDMQIWIERVDGSGTVGIVMEDGHVKGQEPRAEPEKATNKKRTGIAA
jgi:DNA repair exonuclease SbcCD ATPase subunit